MKFGTIAIALVLAGSAFLLFYQLGHEPFQDYDEATYAEITSESLASHHFLSFTFLDRPYFNKPPLLFWLTDTSQSFIKDAQFADRLPSAVSAFLLIALLMVIAYEATQSATVAALAGGVLATTAAFIEPARQVRFDVLVSLFVMAAVFAFCKAFEDRRWFLAFGAFVGLAVLAKGPLAAYAIAGLGAALVYKHLKWLRDPYLWSGVLIALLIAVPWHLYETILFGHTFWEEYLQDQIVDRVGQTLFNGPTNSAYVGYLIQFATPWIYVFGGALLATPFLWKRMSTKVRALLLSSILGAAVVLLVCLLSKTKAISYLIPLYPFMALAIALVISQLATLRIPHFKTALVIFMIGLCLSGFGQAIYNGFHINPYYDEEVTLADEEQPIGNTLHIDHASNFYVYDVTTLGSVMYYSQLVQPLWVGSAPLSAGQYVLMQSSEINQFKKQFPTTKLVIVYQGAYLTLGVAGD